MSASASPQVDPVTEAARFALHEADGDVQRATRLFEARVRADPTLRDALTEPLISGACYDAVRRECRRTRRQVWTPSAPARARASRESTARVVQLASSALLKFPLPGGKALGEATRAEIAEAAEFFGRQASDMGQKARWLTLVAQSIPNGKKARQVLSEKRLAELREVARAD